VVFWSSSGALGVGRLRSTAGQCDRSLRRWAVRGADGASRHGNSGAVQKTKSRWMPTTLSRPGVCDNGAGLAALLGFARAWKSGPRLPEVALSPLLVANVGEEAKAICSHALSVQASGLARRIAAFVVADGANTITSPAGHWAAGASRPVFERRRP